MINEEKKETVIHISKPRKPYVFTSVLSKLILKHIGKKDGNETGVSVAGSIVSVPTSNDWKNNQFIAQGNGYINVCHFSDTFLIYVNYEVEMNGYWLRDSMYEKYPLLIGEIGTEYHPAIYQKHNIYISFLQTCMDFFVKQYLKEYLYENAFQQVLRL